MTTLECLQVLFFFEVKNAPANSGGKKGILTLDL